MVSRVGKNVVSILNRLHYHTELQHLQKLNSKSTRQMLPFLTNRELDLYQLLQSNNDNSAIELPSRNNKIPSKREWFSHDQRPQTSRNQQSSVVLLDRVGNDDYFPQGDEYEVQVSIDESGSSSEAGGTDDQTQEKKDTTKVFFGKPDCGQGDANWPTKGPCDPPECPCEPMGKPGYPTKPKPDKEPFCVECPEKKPCNLNKCPESKGTSRDLFQKISFILNYKSQRSGKISGIHVRHYGDLRRQCGPLMIQSRHGSGGPPPSSGKPPETVEKSKKEEKPEKISCTLNKNQFPCGKLGEKQSPESTPVKVVYQQCPPVPELPKVPECVNPPLPVPPKCPPLPEVPKCPPVETKCPPPAQTSGAPCAKKTEGSSSSASQNSAQNLWGKFTSCFKKRGMSTDARNFSSDSDEFNEKRCKKISEICEKRGKSSLGDECEAAECPKNQRTSCRPERVKCSAVKGKAVSVTELPPVEKIDYSKISCERPKFEKLGSCPTSKASVCPDQKFFVCNDEMVNGKARLPRPPSLPVVLCPCSPPPKLSAGSCPCPNTTGSQKSDQKPAEPPKSCPQKLKYPCPEVRVFYCPLNSQSQRSKCQK